MTRFNKTNKTDWLAKVEQDLKGKPIENLDWEMSGLKLSPIYTEGDIETLNPIDTGNPSWEIGHIIECRDNYLEGNKRAISALERGANALIFDISKSIDLTDITTLLKDIQLEWISTHFTLSSPVDIDLFIQQVSNFCIDNNFNTNNINCSFRTNNNTNERKSHFAFPKSRDIFISPLSYDKDIAELLSTMLSHGNRAIENLMNTGIQKESINSKIQFALEASDYYFLNIAMIRAYKLLWQNVLTAWNIGKNQSAQIEIHVSNLDQVEDPNTNKIKAGSQAMSAAIAGVERIIIHPTGNLSSFSERIALNVHHLMQEEAYMTKVADPSAGSYFIEYLTDKICELTWSAFQKKEA